MIDNNNAALAGDDLYVEKGGAISFGATHNNVLSDFEGCGHAIDGWYVDAKDSRWSAHGEVKYVEPLSLVLTRRKKPLLPSRLPMAC